MFIATFHKVNNMEIDVHVVQCLLLLLGLNLNFGL